MRDSIQALLDSTLVRSLQLDPDLTPSEAIDRVNEALGLAPSLEVDRDAVRLRRRGVLNPLWLAQVEETHLYHAIAMCDPGGRPYLEQQASALTHATYCELFGDLDVLITLYGVQEEADALMDRVKTVAPTEWKYLAPSRVLLFHRHRTREPDPEAPTSAELVNRIVDDYDSPGLAHERRRLEDAGVFLGATWQLEPGPPLTDVSAYVGIVVHGGHPAELLDHLLRDESIRACLVHLIELDRLAPYSYLARLTCRDLGELSSVVDAMGVGTPGGTHLDTTTFVAAQGPDPLPRVARRPAHQEALDISGIESLAGAALAGLGADAIPAFNRLEPRLQLVVLDGLCELRERVAAGPSDRTVKADLEAVLESFAFDALQGVPAEGMRAPVARVGELVVTPARLALERIEGFAAEGSTSRVLKDCAAALRAARTDGEHRRIAEVLDDRWLRRLERFAGEHESWLPVTRRPEQARVEIGEARRVCAAGIDLVGWLRGTVLPALHDAARSA